MQPKQLRVLKMYSNDSKNFNSLIESYGIADDLKYTWFNKLIESNSKVLDWLVSFEEAIYQLSSVLKLVDYDLDEDTTLGSEYSRAFTYSSNWWYQVNDCEIYESNIKTMGTKVTAFFIVSFDAIFQKLNTGICREIYNSWYHGHASNVMVASFSVAYKNEDCTFHHYDCNLNIVPYNVSASTRNNSIQFYDVTRGKELNLNFVENANLTLLCSVIKSNYELGKLDFFVGFAKRKRALQNDSPPAKS